VLFVAHGAGETVYDVIESDLGAALLAWSQSTPPFLKRF